MSTDGLNVIPMNSETIATKPSEQTTVPSKQDQTNTLDPTAGALPKIDIILTQCCSIPLVRCDYESVLKAADTHRKETSTESAVESGSPP